MKLCKLQFQMWMKMLWRMNLPVNEQNIASVTPGQAVQLILKAGGIPVLAHPVLYRMSDTRLRKLVKELKEDGLVGIEAIYSTYASSEERDIRRIAADYNLCISGGSDFHGTNKPGLDLGTGYGHLFVPEEVLGLLKEHRNKETG